MCSSNNNPIVIMFSRVLIFLGFVLCWQLFATNTTNATNATNTTNNPTGVASYGANFWKDLYHIAKG